MVIILNVGIVLIPFQSKVIYLYALPIILFTCDIATSQTRINVLKTTQPTLINLLLASSPYDA